MPSTQALPKSPDWPLYSCQNLREATMSINKHPEMDKNESKNYLLFMAMAINNYEI